MESPYLEETVIKKLDFKFSIDLPKKRVSQRSDLMQQISDCTGIPFKVLLTNTYHLKGQEGVKVLQIILEDTLRFSEHKGARRDKCALLVAKSKGQYW